MPGRSKVGGGKEEHEEETEVRQENKDVMNAIRAADPVNSTGSGDWTGAVGEDVRR